MNVIDFTKYKITQLGYVYKDIEKHVNLFESTFGIQKFAYFENKGVVYKYRGKETKIWNKIAFSNAFGLQIELIQMIEGDCIYSEFINAGKEGFHHFAIFVNELKPIRENLLNKGFEIVHEGTTATVNTVHFDTTSLLGAYLEFQEPRKRKK